MTPQELIKSRLPIMQAFAEGKEIQFRRVGVLDWVAMKDYETLVNDSVEMRLKPEPREWWFIQCDWSSSVLYSSKKSVENICGRGLGTIIHVREVLD